ncbi:MAG: AHH domain-containing protein [Gammaproteobacteria bacterium]|nr:AHH domain-containing protein [Gammaproteobacteria bacterium]
MPQMTLSTALVALMENDKKCEYKPEKEKWRANISGSGTKLALQLSIKQAKPVADKESQLSSSHWPSQAHHLIPHVMLNEHKVSDWLNESKKGSKLFADTKYNVDHRNNGKWMPYASSLPEWKTGATKKADRASNKVLMFKVMQLAKIQMHQGRHSASNKYGIGEVPYKKRVSQYLDKIENNAASHFSGKRACEDCKGKKLDGKYPPRDNSVRYVDKASKLIEKDIKDCKIFVSRIAAEFIEAGGITNS